MHHKNALILRLFTLFSCKICLFDFRTAWFIVLLVLHALWNRICQRQTLPSQQSHHQPLQSLPQKRVHYQGLPLKTKLFRTIELPNKSEVFS